MCQMVIGSIREGLGNLKGGHIGNVAVLQGGWEGLLRKMTFDMYADIMEVRE